METRTVIYLSAVRHARMEEGAQDQIHVLVQMGIKEISVLELLPVPTCHRVIPEGAMETISVCALMDL